MAHFLRPLTCLRLTFPREFFTEKYGVLCSPLSLNSPRGDNSADADWASPTKCLWDAPGGFTAREPVKHVWEPVMETLSLQDRGNLEQFFRHPLLIGDTTSSDILEELGNLS